MSATSHPPELELLRKQVTDLARELTERDQAFRHQNQQLDDELQGLREQSRCFVLSSLAPQRRPVKTFSNVSASSVLGAWRAVRNRGRGPTRGRQNHSYHCRCFRRLLVENFEYPLVGTPCESALRRSFACFERDVRASFPTFERLEQLHVEGYCGVTLSAKDGTGVGLLAVMDTKPLRDTQRLKSLMTVLHRAPEPNSSIARRKPN